MDEVYSVSDEFIKELYDDRPFDILPCSCGSYDLRTSRVGFYYIVYCAKCNNHQITPAVGKISAIKLWNDYITSKVNSKVFKVYSQWDTTIVE